MLVWMYKSKLFFLGISWRLLVSFTDQLLNLRGKPPLPRDSLRISLGRLVEK
jgi:hypothetical protein